MELDKKTTVLFSEELHERLTRLARYRKTSLGSLVREACVAQYGLFDQDTRLEAVQELGALSLPVASPEQMKREATPKAEELLP